MKVLDSLKSFGEKAFAPLLVAALLIGYDQFLRPRPQPPQTPFVVACKQYYKTLPAAYEVASKQVKDGKIQDKAALVAYLKEHARPLATALDEGFVPFIDPTTGKFTNPAGAADLLDQASKGLGAK